MKRKSLQRGTAAVEFALILPLLLVLTLMVTELGRALMQYDTLTKSVRDAARYLSVQTPHTHQAQAQNLVVYGNTAGTGTPLVPGLSLANVPAPTWQPAGSVPAITTVTVQVTGFTFQPMIQSVFGLSLGPYTFGAISATMRSPS
ncbi:MAG: pilus assembly protein [Burkholderiales bacterium]|nr:pilus assembly protein [Burkholderiales bacterium]